MLLLFAFPIIIRHSHYLHHHAAADADDLARRIDYWYEHREELRSEELKNQVQHFIKQYKEDMSNEKFPMKEFQDRQNKREEAKN